ncbi:MAG: SUMF1/EgtB/PvdO family nonheme iron enzyme [Saprospiraceae bacterium]|nr:SUMF1/EgtB/PvdO family nonheme iron enzyme [Saprospiraceae bacterium]
MAYSSSFRSPRIVIPLLVILGIAIFCAFIHFINQPPSKPELILIQGGTFSMGQENGEKDEQPIHEVILSDFQIAKYEITVEEYRKFCKSTNCSMPDEPKWGWIDNHPIINTTWNDAMAYIRWLNKELNENYRLPTESEFEYVLREGGKKMDLPWGDGIPRNENIADETFGKTHPSKRIWAGYNDGHEFTAPIGSFPANALGIHDINGNIWEWCMDWYQPYESLIKTNPQGANNGTYKVGRGASYNADPWHCRSASRSFVEPTFKGPGFRLAK